jgi:hypothetical protein
VAPPDSLAAASDDNTVGIAVGASVGGLVLLGIIAGLVFVCIIRPRERQRVVKDLDDNATPLRNDEMEMLQQRADVQVLSPPKTKKSQLDVVAHEYFEGGGGEADIDAPAMLSMSVVSHGGVDYTIVDEDDEGFYDADGYYHYYEDDDT